jgi:hypothetical protein
MSITTKFMVLSLAAALSSPVHQHQIDYTTTTLDRYRINQLWLVTYINEAGLEVVAQAKLTNGDKTPLIAADQARMESMMPAARELTKSNKITMHLIKFTGRVDIEDIAP